MFNSKPKKTMMLFYHQINIKTIKTRKKLQCKKDIFSDIGYKILSIKRIISVDTYHSSQNNFLNKHFQK